MSTDELRTEGSRQEEDRPAAGVTDPRIERSAGRKQPRSGRTLSTVVVIVGALLIVAASFRLLAAGGEGRTGDGTPTASVRRGRLTVSVTEGGTLRAMRSLEIKSEVEGNNQILEIVEEGTVITREDVEAGKVLMRLDDSSLRDREADRETSYLNAEASYVQAKENYDIQVKQNTSNINAARLRVRFARMELERYLGSALAARLLEEEEFDFALLQGIAQGVVEEILGSESTTEALRDVYDADLPAGRLPLGGQAQQRLRDLSADVQLADQELERAQDTLKWSEQLAEREYVSANQLTADQLSYNRATVRVQSAQEELRLFIRYTLPREAESRWSDYEEALLDLDRVEARARSEMAQASATRQSRERNYHLEKERLERTRQMIEKSTIRATTPGVVVYASTVDPRRYRNNPIQEGSSVRENETIITIPDVSTMAVRVNIQETDIARVRPGQPSRITVEALEGSSFPGTVTRISPMASSEHRWLNPDIMVYETDIRMEEVPDNDVTPGMSATAEIIIAELEDVLYVPLQAVSTYRGRRVCWVRTPDGPQRRTVETGYFTDRFVEIRDGLHEGEQVYLAPPEGVDEEDLEGIAPEDLLDEEPDAEAPEPDEEAGELQELQQRMQQMSPEERQEFIQNLPEEQRNRLMQQFQRSSPGDVPGQGGDGPGRGAGAGPGRGGGSGGGAGRPGAQ